MKHAYFNISLPSDISSFTRVTVLTQTICTERWEQKKSSSSATKAAVHCSPFREPSDREMAKAARMSLHGKPPSTDIEMRCKGSLPHSSSSRKVTQQSFSMFFFSYREDFLSFWIAVSASYSQHTLGVCRKVHLGYKSCTSPADGSG